VTWLGVPPSASVPQLRALSKLVIAFQCTTSMPAPRRRGIRLTSGVMTGTMTLAGASSS
jgi:hypothetical protein